MADGNSTSKRGFASMSPESCGDRSKGGKAFRRQALVFSNRTWPQRGSQSGQVSGINRH
jgi:hypothetical protein